MTKYFAKYRGKVENNIDPMMLGRVQVSAPAVLRDKLSWAMPCVPYAGSGVGLFAIPPNGANVWVEFEAGDPEHPIYSGCFWGEGEVPATPAIPTTKMFRTDGITLILSDVPGAGGFTVEVNPPVVSHSLRLALTSRGIDITNEGASVRLTPVSVSLNDGALEVT